MTRLAPPESARKTERKVAIAGLREVVDISRTAMHAEIAACGNDLTNPAVVAAAKRYQEACRDLAQYEAPRLQAVMAEVSQRIDQTPDLATLRSRLQELLQLEPPTIEGLVASNIAEPIQATPEGPMAPAAGHYLLLRGTFMFVRLADAGEYQLWMRLGTGDDELIYDGEFTAVLAKAAELAEHDGPWLPDEWVILDADLRQIDVSGGYPPLRLDEKV